MKRIRCTKCRQYKPRSKFGSYKRKRNGLNSWCKKCHTKAGRLHIQHTLEQIRQYKLNHGCKDCGYCEHYAALQFDHVRGKKAFTIGEFGERGWKMVFKEINKCEVVCANCHSVRTCQRALKLRRQQKYNRRRFK